MKNDKILSKLKENGVKFLDENSTIVDDDCKIGKGSVIFPNNYILKGTIIGENCVIEEGNHFENSKIGNDNKILKSVVENSEILDNNQIGANSNLAYAKIFSNTKIGNFVEIKNSKIFDSSVINSLSCLKNCIVKECVIIGSGVIFCCYNDYDKFFSVVEKNCFVGSNSTIISPVIIGENSFIACGCTIYKNIESNRFVVSSIELKIKEDYKKIHLKKFEKS